MSMECFPCDTVERVCACGQPRRPQQRDCYACHAAASRAYRRREAERKKAAHDRYLAEIASRAKSAANSASGAQP